MVLFMLFLATSPGTSACGLGQTVVTGSASEDISCDLQSALGPLLPLPLLSGDLAGQSGIAVHSRVPTPFLGRVGL